MSRTAPRALLSTLGLTLALALAGCGNDDEPRNSGDSRPSPTPTESTSAAQPVDDDDYTEARSETREDSVYPDVGDPLVDALHYQLDLSWDPASDELSGEQTLTFRATDDATSIPLDFSDALEISALTIDGKDAEFDLDGKDLRVDAPVVRDQTYELALSYAGTPEPAPPPSERPDFQGGVGWQVTDEHEAWTMQEPYGAFTWYAVNDQPADKAFYDFTLTTPDPMSGVANGVLTDSTTDNGTSTNTWHLDEPASSYLVTVAFGEYQRTDLKSKSGVPVQIWADADGDATPGDTAYAPQAIDWLESVLGPYPFDSFGIVVIDGDSGMETQTMVTLGNTPYSLSAPVVVHEAAHHWYGDTVTPSDWSDVWMNEGMAMYLQGMWEAEQQGMPIEQKMDDWADYEAQVRASAGPPADYDPDKFGDSNIYYGPALMWQELREKIGDKKFFKVLRAWPAAQENENSDREEYWAWLEKTTGEELSDFFDDWLLGKTTPDRD